MNEKQAREAREEHILSLTSETKTEKYLKSIAWHLKRIADKMEDK